MGDIARCSIGSPADYYNEELLYGLFGVNAELLIGHAWGWEPCTIADVKAYTPEFNSIGSGQVLPCPYSCDKARLVVREMADALALDLVDKSLATDQLTLTVGYDIENIQDAERRKQFKGEVKTDRYGRAIPKHAHGTVNLGTYTSSTKVILTATSELYDRIVDRGLLIRRLSLTANRVLNEQSLPKESGFEQLDLFEGGTAAEQDEATLAREKKIQSAMLGIKKSTARTPFSKA